MINEIKELVRFYIPFDDDDVLVLEGISLLQDVAVTAIIKINDYELIEFLQANKDQVSSEEKTKWFAKVLRRHNVDIYKESRNPATARKFISYYGNPVKGRRTND